MNCVEHSIADKQKMQVYWSDMSDMELERGTWMSTFKAGNNLSFAHRSKREYAQWFSCRENLQGSYRPQIVTSVSTPVRDLTRVAQ